MVLHFTPDASALLLIDYQVGTLQLARINPASLAVHNAILLAKAALAFDMPIVLISSQEDRIEGRIDERLQAVVPDAFEARVKRQGIVDAWKDPNFKRAVERTGRRQLIMGRSPPTSASCSPASAPSRTAMRCRPSWTPVAPHSRSTRSSRASG